MSDRSSFGLSVLAFVAVLIAAERTLAYFAPRFFLPTRKMEAALAQGPGCIVVLGDSRMEAGVDEASLSEALISSGHSSCVAKLTLGGVPLEGQVVALREYLRRGGKPRAVVLGISL